MTDNAQMRECAQEEQKPAVIADVIMQAIAEEERSSDQLRARVAELEAELETAKRRIVHLDGRLSEVNGEVLRLEMATKHMLKLQEERDAAVIKVEELEADRRRVSDMVNKAWADGKAEGHGDATAEASVVIGELRAHVSTLEADLKEVEKQEPVAWLDKSTEERPGDTVWLPGDLKGMDTSWLVPLYAAPPVTAPVRLTDEQIAESHANEIMNCLQDPCDKSESVMPMPHDVNRFVRAIETAVLRANGFKVEG